MESFFTTIVNGLECMKCGMILNNTSLFLHVRQKQCYNEMMKNMEKFAEIAKGFKRVTSMNIQRLSLAIQGATKSRLDAASKEKEKQKELEQTKKKEKEIQKKKRLELQSEMFKERHNKFMREKTEQKERERREKQELERKEKCSVCHEDLNQNIDSPCKHGHFFHYQCIQSLKDHNQRKCPICRTSITKFLETFILNTELKKE